MSSENSLFTFIFDNCNRENEFSLKTQKNEKTGIIAQDNNGKGIIYGHRFNYKSKDKSLSLHSVKFAKNSTEHEKPYIKCSIPELNFPEKEVFEVTHSGDKFFKPITKFDNYNSNGNYNKFDNSTIEPEKSEKQIIINKDNLNNTSGNKFSTINFSNHDRSNGMPKPSASNMNFPNINNFNHTQNVSQFSNKQFDKYLHISPCSITKFSCNNKKGDNIVNINSITKITFNIIPNTNNLSYYLANPEEIFNSSTNNIKSGLFNNNHFSNMFSLKGDLSLNKSFHIKHDPNLANNPFNKITLFEEPQSNNNPFKMGNGISLFQKNPFNNNSRESNKSIDFSLSNKKIGMRSTTKSGDLSSFNMNNSDIQEKKPNECFHIGDKNRKKKFIKKNKNNIKVILETKTIKQKKKITSSIQTRKNALLENQDELNDCFLNECIESGDDDDTIFQKDNYYNFHMYLTSQDKQRQYDFGKKPTRIFHELATDYNGILNHDSNKMSYNLLEQKDLLKQNLKTIAKRVRNIEIIRIPDQSQSKSNKKIKQKNSYCYKCGIKFQNSQALGGHAAHKHKKKLKFGLKDKLFQVSKAE